jgi:hypothetical protein
MTVTGEPEMIARRLAERIAEVLDGRLGTSFSALLHDTPAMAVITPRTARATINSSRLKPAFDRGRRAGSASE